MTQYTACEYASCVDCALTTQPNGTPPVAVAAKEVGVGLGWYVLHAILLPLHFHHKGMVTVVPRERTDAVRCKKLVLVQQVLQDALKALLGRNSQQVAEHILLLDVRVVSYLEEGRGRGRAVERAHPSRSEVSHCTVRLQVLHEGVLEALDIQHCPIPT